MVSVVLKAPGAQEAQQGTRQRQGLHGFQSVRPQLLSDLQPAEMRQDSRRRCEDINTIQTLLCAKLIQLISFSSSQTFMNSKICMFIKEKLHLFDPKYS